MRIAKVLNGTVFFSRDLTEINLSGSFFKQIQKEKGTFTSKLCKTVGSQAIFGYVLLKKTDDLNLWHLVVVAHLCGQKQMQIITLSLRTRRFALR